MKKVILFEDAMNHDFDCKQRRQIVDIERQVLIRLIDILEKEKMISVEERNLAIRLIEKGVITQC